jgi:hypothetical protein
MQPVTNPTGAQGDYKKFNPWANIFTVARPIFTVGLRRRW